jgi:DNA-binding CsgD family transcriptional regulator
MVGSAVLSRLETLQAEACELGPLSDACRAHVLAKTAELLRAAAGCVILDDDTGPGRRGRIVEAATHNFDGATAPAFQPLIERGSAFHPLVERTFNLFDGVGVCVETARGLLGVRAWLESPYYCEFVRPVGFDDCIMSVGGAGQPGIGRGFGFYRERGRPFGDDDKLILRLVEFGLGRYVHRPPPPPDLSPRDRDVLQLLCEGLGDKEIASRLGISRHTVNQRNKRLFRRFGVHSRSELVARRWEVTNPSPMSCAAKNRNNWSLKRSG